MKPRGRPGPCSLRSRSCLEPHAVARSLAAMGTRVARAEHLVCHRDLFAAGIGRGGGAPVAPFGPLAAIGITRSRRIRVRGGGHRILVRRGVARRGKFVRPARWDDVPRPLRGGAEHEAPQASDGDVLLLNPSQQRCIGPQQNPKGAHRFRAGRALQLVQLGLELMDVQFDDRRIGRHPAWPPRVPRVSSATIHLHRPGVRRKSKSTNDLWHNLVRGTAWLRKRSCGASARP